MIDWSNFWITVGITGDIIVLGVYLLLQAGKVSSDGCAYLIWNVIGSSAIILGFIADWRLSEFLVESSWLMISLGALLRLFWDKYQSYQAKKDDERTRALVVSLPISSISVTDSLEAVSAVNKTQRTLTA